MPAKMDPITSAQNSSATSVVVLMLLLLHHEAGVDRPEAGVAYTRSTMPVRASRGESGTKFRRDLVVEPPALIQPARSPVIVGCTVQLLFPRTDPPRC